MGDKNMAARRLLLVSSFSLVVLCLNGEEAIYQHADHNNALVHGVATEAKATGNSNSNSEKLGEGGFYTPESAGPENSILPLQHKKQLLGSTQATSRTNAMNHSLKKASTRAKKAARKKQRAKKTKAT